MQHSMSLSMRLSLGAVRQHLSDSFSLSTTGPLNRHRAFDVGICHHFESIVVLSIIYNSNNNNNNNNNNIK